jgi:hypothetical protein
MVFVYINNLAHDTGDMLTGRKTGVLFFRSPAEVPWLECGMVGDVMPRDRGRYVEASTTFDATIQSEKNTPLFYSASGCGRSDMSVRLESE